MEIRISPRALNTVLSHAKMYANAKLAQKEWKIVYGFLCGTIQDKDISVYEAIPMIHGDYYHVYFEEGDYLDVARINAEIAEKECFLVGWYHSHPGRGFFLHEEDIKNQLGMQGTNPTAFVLVVDPQQAHQVSQGIEIFRLDDADLGALSGYHTVKWTIDQKLEEYRVEGPVVRELTEKELGKNLKMEF